jgi:hypothetical protein
VPQQAYDESEPGGEPPQECVVSEPRDEPQLELHDEAWVARHEHEGAEYVELSPQAIHHRQRDVQEEPRDAQQALYDELQGQGAVQV